MVSEGSMGTGQRISRTSQRMHAGVGIAEAYATREHSDLCLNQPSIARQEPVSCCEKQQLR